jgi:hypothetical protein
MQTYLFSFMFLDEFRDDESLLSFFLCGKVLVTQMGIS